MMVLDSAADRRKRAFEMVQALDFRHWVGGKRIESPGTNQSVPVRDPFLDTQIAQIPAADPMVVEMAVGAARLAFDEGPWPRMHPRQRAKLLYRIADEIDAHLEDLALLEAINVGKAIAGVRGWDVPNAAEVFRYYAGWADKIVGQALPDFSGARITTSREPIGVCVALLPWNFPFADMAWKLAPALAAGCTVVMKPSERAPLSAMALTQILERAGFPDGVVNVVTGGVDTGQALVAHTGIDKISFTGSAETARNIVRDSSVRMPRLTLELGGKSPNVVMADADLRAAAEGAVGAMFSVAGQDCGAGSRLLVEAPVMQEFLALLVPLVNERVVGDALDDETQQGPQIDRAHLASIDSAVRHAVASGFEVLCGGSSYDDERSSCYRPTLLSGGQTDSAIWRDEVFGPVATVTEFEGLEEAIRLANDTEYGLAGGIWTGSTASAERFVRRLNAGTAWVNCYGWFDTTSPWGGRGLSGYGKELGAEGLDGYLTTKSIFRLPV